MLLLTKWSRRLAGDLGEDRGRSISSVLGEGLSSLTGGLISGKVATDVVHGVMLINGLAGFSGKVAWSLLAKWGLPVFGILWLAGQARRN